MKKVFSVLVVLFVSFQLNAQWVQSNGINNRTVMNFAESGTNIFAATADSGVYLSTNDGANWTQVNYGLTSMYVNALAVKGNNIFAGVDNYLGGPGGVYLSTNNGTSWEQINNGLTNTYVLSFVVTGNNIFVSTRYNGGVFLSTNNGANWAHVNNGLTNTYVLCFVVSGNNTFVGTSNGVFLSTNNGTNWTQVNNGLPGIDTIGISSLAVCGTNIFACTNTGYIYLSTNNGTNWSQVKNGLTYPTIHSLAVSGNNIFAYNFVNVFLSTNNGTNWTNVSDNLNTDLEVLSVTGTNIFVGTEGAGVWRRPLSELTGVSKEVKTLPQEYTLFQNYPNPYNPSTAIKYTIPSESNVNIRFYNSLGQIVSEVNEGNRQPGNYEINFNSAGLASGIYFYSIEALSSDGKNDFTAVKKMMLLK